MFRNNKVLIVPKKLNKLLVLKSAEKFGLKIPLSKVTQSKENIKIEDKEIITKSIGDLFWYKDDDINVKTRTVQLTDEILSDLKETIFPSLIQEKVDKIYELRVVFLNRSFYTMAIVPSSDNKDNIDFRVSKGPSSYRFVPYILDEKTSECVTNLMEFYSLSFGIIDFIVTKERELVFLEINPLGDTAFISGPCSYKIDKHISTYFSDVERLQ